MLPDDDVVTMGELMGRDLFIVDKGTVGTLEISQDKIISRLVDSGMVTRHGKVVYDDGIIIQTTHGDTAFEKRELFDHLFIECED
jgi:hypothetical protein